MQQALEMMERLNQLPDLLRPQHKLCIAEATGAEARAQMAEFYEREGRAHEATFDWAKAHGAGGFYAPYRHAGREDLHAEVFSFNTRPEGKAWVKAGSHYTTNRGQMALALSRKHKDAVPLREELKALPGFPAYAQAAELLGNIDTLRYGESDNWGFMTVGHDYRTHQLYHTVPIQVFERYFIRFPNHNKTIWQHCETAVESPEYETRLDFRDDPISWRPPEGWTLISEPDFDLLVAEARVRQLREKQQESAAA